MSTSLALAVPGFWIRISEKVVQASDVGQETFWVFF